MVTSRQAAAQATKQNIVQAAIRIVGESGYDALTTNQLIKEAGIAKGTLYHHFESLDDVICDMMLHISQVVFAEVPIDKYDTIEAYLEDLGVFCLDVVSNDTTMMNLFYGFIPKGFNNDKFKALVEQIFKLAAEQVTPAIQKFYNNSATPEKIDAAIRLVDIFTMGFCVHQRIFNDRVKYIKLWHDFSKMLIRFLDE